MTSSLNNGWATECRPTPATLRLAIRWTERAAADVESKLRSAGRRPSQESDHSALKSRLGKIQSGRRFLTELMEHASPPSKLEALAQPLRIAGKDLTRSARSRVDHVLEHVTGDSLAQIAAALNANVFRFNRVRSRQLRILRTRLDRSGPAIVELGWTNESAIAALQSADTATDLRPADAAAITRGGGERFSLVQFFNAGSFQAAFTAGASEQARSLNFTMNDRDPADGDMRAMKRRIDATIADPRTAGVIIHSGQAVELHPLVERARRAGKAVVTSNLLAPPLNTPSIVLNDIGAGAMLAVALLADMLDRPASDLRRSPSGRLAETGAIGHVILIGGGERELPHMRLRQQGFLDAIAEQRGVTCREIPGSGATILPKIVEHLRRKSAPLAIVAFYDDVARYAAQAIEMSKAGKHTSLYGVDLGDPEIEEMESHDFWRASIAFDAFALGAAVTRLLAAAIRVPRWTAQQRFPITIDGVLVRREQILKLRDRTAAGLARAVPELKRDCDAVVPDAKN
ncbi:MAG: substrate-binding domain-containing protein [Anaerolineae bacterium]|nr:substrate-binding domain-containing protein [Phycisphaerae bacterium]